MMHKLASQVMARRAFLRSTPPALFPPILGFFATGLLLRSFGQALGGQGAAKAVAAFAEVWLGAGVMLLAGVLAAYVAKLFLRPGTLLEDLRILPGRTGVAAALVASYCAAAALAPYAMALATGVVLVALVAHVGLIALLAGMLLNGPPEGRQVSPTWHLIFMGFIVAPFALIPLGFSTLAGGLLSIGVLGIGIIWLLALPKALRTPAPLRPTLAIHLAPASVFAANFTALGFPALGLAFGLWALVLAVLLLARLRWLTEAGFSPFWGAFTFPLAAFGQAALRTLGPPGLWLGAVVAVAAVIIVPWIGARIFRMWPSGLLAQRTNAAVA